MAGVGVVFNPHARGHRRQPGRLDRLRAIVGGDGEVAATKSLADLDTALRRFHDSDVDVLVVAGGDGTAYHVLSRAVALWSSKDLPAVLPLCGGTINNLARTLGTRRARPETLLATVVANRRAGRSHDVLTRNLLVVNGSQYGYIAGAGLISGFLKLYYAGKHPGEVRALWLLARLGASYFLGTRAIDEVVAKLDAEIRCDGRVLPLASYTLILASTITDIGLGVRPFYASDDPDGAFHVLAGNSTPGELLTRLWRFFRSRPADLASLCDCTTRSLEIEFARPQPVTINGEVLAPMKSVRIETGPQVRFIRG